MIAACRHPGCDRCCERGPGIQFDYCCVWWRTLARKQLTGHALLPAALSALSIPWQYIVYTSAQHCHFCNSCHCFILAGMHQQPETQAVTAEGLQKL